MGSPGCQRQQSDVQIGSTKGGDRECEFQCDIRVNGGGGVFFLSISLSFSRLRLSRSLRATLLVRAKVKITVKNTVFEESTVSAYGVFDCEFGFHSHDWS